MTEALIAAHTIAEPTLEAGFESALWAGARPIIIDRIWQGDAAPPELQTTARLLWTDDELIVGFQCLFTELDIDDDYDLTVERHGLWDRDVCEIFVRSPNEPATTTYKEFEVAPTGQWCDLKIDRLTRVHDWEWKSGMRTATGIDREGLIWRATMALPFAAFGERPSVGDEWCGNLFRVSRFRGERVYLAYSPNNSERPNFHVPESFVKIEFR